MTLLTVPTTSRRRRGSSRNTQWLLLVVVLILSMLSQAHVAVAQQDPPTVDDTPVEEPSSSPIEEPSSPTETEKPTNIDRQNDEPTAEPDDDTTNRPTSPSIELLPTRRPTGEPVPTEEPAVAGPTVAPTDEVPDDGDTPTVAPSEETVFPTTSPSIMETNSPTVMITNRPTVKKTKRPTTSPIEMESSSPTETFSSAPSGMPVPIDVQDTISVIVMPLSETMSTSNAQHFEITAEKFLSDFLSQLEPPISNVNVTITGQALVKSRRRERRFLQESSSLQVDMIVAGSLDPVEGGMANETADDFDIGQISEEYFDVQGDKFVEMLKDTDNADDAAFFASVSSVESASYVGTLPPTNEQPAETGGVELSVGIIVVIAVVGSLVVFLVVVVLVYKKNRGAPNNNNVMRTDSDRQTSSRQNVPLARQSGGEATSFKRLKDSKRSSSGEQQLLPPIKEVVGGGRSSGVVLTRVDSDVQSDLQSGYGAEESMLGMESNMSYAYSLEDGINATMSEYSTDVNNMPVPSEIARSSSFQSDRNDENDFLDPSDNAGFFEPDSSHILREITAPPGKLGLVLTTSDRGPVVQQVASGSPLEGIVWPGDVITSIDGIKTLKMSADQMTQYMTTNLFKKRKLTVLSDGQA